MIDCRSVLLCSYMRVLNYVAHNDTFIFNIIEQSKLPVHV